VTFDPSQQQPPAAPQPGAPTPPPATPFPPVAPGAVPPAGAPRPAVPAGGYAQPAQGQPVPSFIPPTVAAAVANPKPKSRVAGGTALFVVAVVVAAAGLGFAAGRVTAPASTGRTGFAGNFGGGNFPGGSFAPGGAGNANRGGFGGFGAGNISVTGQVTAVANGSITIQTASGQSVTLEVPSTATYHAQASAAPSDVTVGSQVQVSASRPNFRAEGSAAPAPSGQPGAQGGLTVTDITLLSK
jgi:hypothetical protein